MRQFCIEFIGSFLILIAHARAPHVSTPLLNQLNPTAANSPQLNELNLIPIVFSSTHVPT